MKKELLLIVLFVTTLLATPPSNISLDPDVLNKKEPKRTYKYQNPLNHKLFLYTGLGVSHISMINKLKDELQTRGTSDNNGLNGELGIGYKNNFFATTAFIQRTSLSNADITNLALGASYYFDDRVYLGALAGQSFLSWKNSPVKDTTKESKNLRQAFLGAEFGMDHPVFKNISFYTKYQLLILNHKTNINDKKAVIQHNIQNNIGLGVKYGF